MIQNKKKYRINYIGLQNTKNRLFKPSYIDSETKANKRNFTQGWDKSVYGGIRIVFEYQQQQNNKSKQFKI